MTRTWFSLKDQPIFVWAGLLRISDGWGPVHPGVMVDADERSSRSTIGCRFSSMLTNTNTGFTAVLVTRWRSRSGRFRLSS